MTAELLNIVKLRCGIPAAVTVYDENELKPLVRDALDDMRTAGVPGWILEDSGADTNPRVITCIVLYVQAMRGSDRKNTNLYMRLYKSKLHKLMLEPETEGGWEDVDDINSTSG